MRRSQGRMGVGRGHPGMPLVFCAVQGNSNAADGVQRAVADMLTDAESQVCSQ